ncbi:MAG TPA: hypothetical protein VJ276_18415 [Thermoanaerobaculia bacterium]|nr:hypothetical protein [Thermoanaerobaculia bacterium]
MAALLIALAALAVIAWDLWRSRRDARRWLVFARAVPFVVVSGLSLLAASRAPHGRKAFSLDASVSAADLAQSMTKVPHLKSIAVIFLLAVIAFGVSRLTVAFAATMLIGIGWELAEGTVVGHHARVADLAPNIASGLACLAIVALMRWIANAVRRNAA